MTTLQTFRPIRITIFPIDLREKWITFAGLICKCHEKFIVKGTCSVRLLRRDEYGKLNSINLPFECSSSQNQDTDVNQQRK